MTSTGKYSKRNSVNTNSIRKPTMKMMTKTATLACMLLLGFTVKLQAQSNQPADESWRNVARPGDSTEARLRSLLKDLEDNPPEATNDRLKVLAQIRKINAAMATRRQQNLAFDTRKLIEPGTV